MHDTEKKADSSGQFFRPDFSIGQCETRIILFPNEVQQLLVELRKISSCSTDGELKVLLRCQMNPLDKTYSASRYELPQPSLRLD